MTQAEHIAKLRETLLKGLLWINDGYRVSIDCDSSEDAEVLRDILEAIAALPSAEPPQPLRAKAEEYGWHLARMTHFAPVAERDIAMRFTIALEAYGEEVRRRSLEEAAQWLERDQGTTTEAYGATEIRALALPKKGATDER